MNRLRIRAVLLLALTCLSGPVWAQIARSPPASQPIEHATTEIKHATAEQTATLLLEAYNPDGSAVSASDFANYTNFTPTSTWGIYLNYGVFPLGTPPATEQVGSAPSFVSQGGLQYISFAVPANQPLYFTCLWKAQAIGTVFMRADNASKGYTLSDNQTLVLQLPYEFALSEYNTASQLVSQYSASGYTFSANAEALLAQSSAAVDKATRSPSASSRALASYAALAIIMPLKERLVLEISNASISRVAPRQDFVLNYEGWGEWVLYPASVIDYPRAKKAGFSSVVTLCDWGTILKSQGIYDFSALDYEIDSALALGYNVSLIVNERVESLPSWAQALSFDDLKTLYYQNAQTAVDRYKDQVASIYAIGEIELTGQGYSLDQLAELAGQSFAGARAAAPSMSFGFYASAAAYVGYQWNGPASGCECISSLDLLEYLSKNNVEVDYVGLEMQYGTVFAPLDLQRVYEVLTTYHDALNIPINVGDTLYSSRTEDYGSPASFYWHDGLTEGAQAEWADGFLRVAYGLPFVKEFWWDHLINDVTPPGGLSSDMGMIGGGVFRSDGSPKLAYFAFQNFLNSVLLARPSDVAPVLTSQTPAADIGAVGGQEQEFTVTAQDSDGNSLTYVWSVDGVVVANAIGPSYYWLVPLSATGVHVVCVLVSDGFRSTQTTWHINVVPGNKPSILFDETHSELDTISLQLAQQLNPQHPEYVSFAELSGYLTQSYHVSRLTQGPITSQVLSGFAVLVLAAPNAALSDGENQAVAQFVQSGGGLVFMDTTGLNTAINSLLAPWGLQYNPAVILSPSAPSGCPGCYPLSSFSDGSFLGNNPAFQVGYPASFTVSGQAISLGQTSATAWRSNSGQPPQQPGEPNGPFTIIAASSSGSGKVLAVSNNFYDQYFDAYPQNAVLLSSALGWLTSAELGPAPPAPGPPPSITGTANSGSYASGVSPGSWISIFGKNLSNLPPAGRGWGTSDFSGSNLPLSLSGTSVLINGRPAAISFVSPTQLNVQGPDDSTSGTVSVVVTAPAGTAVGTANLQQLAPSLFTISLGGVSYAAAVGTDGAYIVPPKQLAGGQTANPGDIIEVFGTGFGSGLPSQPAGMLVSAVPLAVPVTASICGQPAPVGYAGLAQPGLNQFNITVPNVATGLCSIILSVQGLPTQDGVVIPIGP